MAELSVRYAASLFDLSLQKNAILPMRIQAETVKEALQSDRCRSVLHHPSLSVQEKCAFLSGALSSTVSEELVGVVHILTSNGHIDLIVPTLSLFINMCSMHIGRTVAEVTSAAEMSDEQQATLRSLLSRKHGKEVDLDVKVDRSLIGGLRIRLDGLLFDTSIRKKLNEITGSVKRGVSK